MKIQGEKKRKTKANPETKQKKQQKADTILKLESLELIPYIVDLTGLFLFLGVNNKKKS